MAGAEALVVSEPRRVGLVAAELVANRLRARPHSRLLLPTGHTPRGMYAVLRAHAAAGALPVAQADVFQLDEYLGTRTYAETLARELDGIPFGARHALDGRADDPDAEAARYQALLDERPIDLAVLGLGRDAHVAFNEPGARPGEGVHRVALDPSTLAANAGDFGAGERVPREALTTGLRTLRAAREVLVLVSGAEKADALHAMLEGPVGPHAPASLLRDHPALTVVCDAAAASRLAPRANRDSDLAVVVLGHREPGDDPADHRISSHSRSRLFRAEELCLEEAVRLAVLTGYTHTGSLSEAEQLGREWTVPGVPTLLEVAGRNTAENASRSLPLLLAAGGIRRVAVVSSRWHLRVPLFFGAYRRYGLDVDVVWARPLRHWGHLFARELHELRHARAERAAALGELHLVDPAVADAG